MRFIIKDYLEVLREREELDSILPDLLRAMGWQVIKLAFRGEVEHGVDIAAYDKSENILYLIQTKPGNIDGSNWDTGANSVRTTLNNILDVPFNDLSKPPLREANRKTILVHNGTLRENYRERVNGYLENEFIPNMEFERWDIEDLTELFLKYLFNERILPSKYHKLIKRAIIFIEVPDYDLKDFKELLPLILPKSKTIKKQKRQRVFGFLRMSLALILKQCRENNNILPALNAYEYTVLYVWGWMYRNNFFGKPFIEEFAWTYHYYLQVLYEWVRKITPALLVPDGLASIGPHEVVEYPIRTFNVIGNLGILASHFYLDFQESDKSTEDFNNSIELLKRTIINNSSRHRPLIDNHGIDIFLGLFALLMSGDLEFIIWWLRDIFDHLAVRKNHSNRLPELYNNLDKVLEFEATSERPIDYCDSSSTLIYQLFEFTLMINDPQIYLDYKNTFQDINLQLWYPPDNVEDIMYHREVHEGSTETNIVLPENFDEFRLDVQARHKMDRSDYSPITKGFPIILILANKFHRTPVFPFWWREAIFPQFDPE